MVTRVVLRREKKTITVCTAKKMYTSLNNVIARRSMVNNARTFTRSIKKKRSDGRNKEMTKKRERKSIMSLKRYIITSSSLEMTQ